MAPHLRQVLREHCQLHSVAKLTPAPPQVHRAYNAACVSVCRGSVTLLQGPTHEETSHLPVPSARWTCLRAAALTHLI